MTVPWPRVVAAEMEKQMDSVQVLEVTQLGPTDKVGVGDEGEEGAETIHRFWFKQLGR